MSNFDLALSIMLGVGLAAATGFRVFLPMLVVSVASYTGHLSLGDNFAWLGTPAALTMLGAAALAEIAAYYIPGIDNLLDALAIPAAFVAGTIVSAAVMTDFAADGEMDGGHHCGGRRRRPHARRHRNAQGQFHRLHGRDRQSGPRNLGTRWCAARFASRPRRAARSPRGGPLVFVGSDTSAPAVASSSAWVE